MTPPLRIPHAACTPNDSGGLLRGGGGGLRGVRGLDLGVKVACHTLCRDRARRDAGVPGLADGKPSGKAGEVSVGQWDYRD